MWIFISIVMLVLVFLVWRLTSVRRGARKRDKWIYAELEPVALLLEGGQDVRQEQITKLGARHELRGMLYFFLKLGERLDLVPEEWRTIESQAKARLAYWLIHPNELCDPAETIEVVAVEQRKVENRTAQFVCLKYQMPEGHWSGREWQLGVAGPFFEDSLPYEGAASGFARAGDCEGQIEPKEIIDWYIKMATGEVPQ